MPEPRRNLVVLGPDITRRSWDTIARSVHVACGQWSCPPSDIRLRMAEDTFEHLAFTSEFSAQDVLNAGVIAGASVKVDHGVNAWNVVVEYRGEAPSGMQRRPDGALIESRMYTLESLRAAGYEPVIEDLRRMSDHLIRESPRPGDISFTMSADMRDQLLRIMERRGLVAHGSSRAARAYLFGARVHVSPIMRDSRGETVEARMTPAQTVTVSDDDILSGRALFAGAPRFSPTLTIDPALAAVSPYQFDNRLSSRFSDSTAELRDMLMQNLSTTRSFPVEGGSGTVRTINTLDGSFDTRMARAADKTDSVYAERNALAVAFARMACRLGWPAGWHEDKDKPEAWNTVVIVQFPNGKQISWHMSPDAKGMARSLLPRVPLEWDGTYLGRNMTWPTIFEDLT